MSSNNAGQSSFTAGLMFMAASYRITFYSRGCTGIVIALSPAQGNLLYKWRVNTGILFEQLMQR